MSCLLALPACLVSAVANPAFGLTQLNGQVWVLDPLPPDPVHPQQSHPAGWFSRPADLPLSAASATDIVEVPLEMGVNKRLQENAPERVKPRERTVSQRVQGDGGRRRCRGPDVGYHRLNHEILSHSLLSSELLRASTEKVSYLFYTRGNEGTKK